jgi:hypothetical protein
VARLIKLKNASNRAIVSLAIMGFASEIALKSTALKPNVTQLNASSFDYLILAI